MPLTMVVALAGRRPVEPLPLDVAVDSGPVVTMLTPRPRRPAVPAYQSHPSAIIDDGALIGEGTRIWHFCHICAGTRIGRGCSLGQNVYVAPTAVIGDGCKIQNNVSLYDGVVLEDQVFVGPSAVFTNIGTPRCEFPRRDQYERTLVRHGASIGANATIVCGTTLGCYCLIGAGAVVTKDVPDHALMVGVPARVVGWVSRAGGRLDLPVSAPKGETLVARCLHNGDAYQLCGDVLQMAVGS